ncbi:MAG: hypothetical protein J6B37_02700 [Clostridia bacterium]|nr:hypothetical protein [Clostridia bacterium]
MIDDRVIKQIKAYETEFKSFMRIEDFPSYSLQSKVSTVATANKQGFEVAACTHYQVESRKHTLTISGNLIPAKYLIFHEFTHIFDTETLAKDDVIRYIGVSGFTEYHASQIELLQLLGSENSCSSISFSMNDIIETLSGCVSVQQYINEKQQHAIDLFSRVDFPANINTLKSSMGVLFNYFGLRSICEMYATDYNEKVNNQAYLKYISTHQFIPINNLMHGWLDSARINLSIILYNDIMRSLIKDYNLK